MRLLIAGTAVVLLLLLAVLGESQAPLLVALIVGTGYFASVFAGVLAALPALNPLRLIAAGTGLFYYLGGALNLGSQMAGFSPYNAAWLIWRNYDAAPMAAAAALVFACAALTEVASRFVRLPSMGHLTGARAYYRGVVWEERRERALAWIALSLLSVFCAYLLWTDQLTIVRTARYIARVHESGVGIAGAVHNLAPMTPLVMAWLLFDRRDRLVSRLPALLVTLPIWLSIFALGRRAMIAAMLALAVGYFAFRGAKMRPIKIVGLAAGGAAMFFLLSGPFLEVRRQGLATFDQVVTMIASGQTGGRTMTTGDIAALSVARMDIMGEFAHIIDRFPSDGFHLGGALASHLPIVVPGALWQGKHAYLLTGALSDEEILRQASLPASDLASSQVLYAYVDVAWLAPVMFAAVMTGVLVAFDRMVRVSRSYLLYLMAVSLVISYAVAPDTTWGLRLFGDLRTMLILLVVTAVSTRIMRPSPQAMPRALNRA